MPRHRQLFMHLDSEGTSVSTLARRMNISPPAMGAPVDELLVLGYVNRQETAIARLVVPTARGLAMITLLKDFDDQMEALLRKTARR
jgi:DNA-binding MarR family transcriptional regulator